MFNNQYYNKKTILEMVHISYSHASRFTQFGLHLHFLKKDKTKNNLVIMERIIFFDILL